MLIGQVSGVCDIREGVVVEVDSLIVVVGTLERELNADHRVRDLREEIGIKAVGRGREAKRRLEVRIEHIEPHTHGDLGLLILSRVEQLGGGRSTVRLGINILRNRMGRNLRAGAGG